MATGCGLLVTSPPCALPDSFHSGLHDRWIRSVLFRFAGTAKWSEVMDTQMVREDFRVRCFQHVAFCGGHDGPRSGPQCAASAGTWAREDSNLAPKPQQNRHFPKQAAQKAAHF